MPSSGIGGATNQSRPKTSFAPAPTRERNADVVLIRSEPNRIVNRNRFYPVPPWEFAAPLFVIPVAAGNPGAGFDTFCKGRNTCNKRIRCSGIP
ncbi:MAG: hypothetical protein VX603_14100 [Gemmatimonadota bacterium]|nr:hypothetical protein [Gemmatimonadota bacterium]